LVADFAPGLAPPRHGARPGHSGFPFVFHTLLGWRRSSSSLMSRIASKNPWSKSAGRIIASVHTIIQRCGCLGAQRISHSRLNSSSRTEPSLLRWMRQIFLIQCSMISDPSWLKRNPRARMSRTGTSTLRNPHAVHNDKDVVACSYDLNVRFRFHQQAS